MYVDVVPNRNSPPAVLLRQSWREGKRVRKRTVANLSDWPAEQIQALRKVLSGETLVSAQELFEVLKTTPHGHVEAILSMVRKLGLEQILASKPCRQRDLVVAMIVERLVFPCSKLATTRLWDTTTLGKELQVRDAQVDELYEALDWLLGHQQAVEKKLACRHLCEGCHVLYDVSSSCYEGHVCVLAKHGYNRDKKGLPIIVYGLLCDAQGRPLAVEVYEGATGDPSTVADQVEKLRQRFGLKRVVLVGDRGTLTQTQIDLLGRYPQLGWIGALRPEAIASLVKSGDIDLQAFDKTNLVEIASQDFPGERLVACYNRELAHERGRKRQELLEQTDKLFDKIAQQVARRTKTPLSQAEIAMKAGKIKNDYKMGKHYELEIAEGVFGWQRNEHSIAQEQALDGIYVVRTSESTQQLSAHDIVRGYKQLSQVEQAFRTLKGMDIRVRPIRHWNPDHVRAHIFLCMLSYYVEWHMRKAWAPLLFEDEQLDVQRSQRDPVAPAKCSESAARKKCTCQSEDGLTLHSFDTLLKVLGTRTSNLCQTKATGATFEQVTPADPLQTRAMELLKMYPADGN